MAHYHILTETKSYEEVLRWEKNGYFYRVVLFWSLH
jgi:hypothetical protein